LLWLASQYGSEKAGNIGFIFQEECLWKELQAVVCYVEVVLYGDGTISRLWQWEWMDCKSLSVSTCCNSCHSEEYLSSRTQDNETACSKRDFLRSDKAEKSEINCERFSANLRRREPN